jgi:small subunit ribosomal protein S16
MGQGLHPSGSRAYALVPGFDKHLRQAYNRNGQIYTEIGGRSTSMLRIRLRRVGKKKQPSYRVVVADARTPRDGRFVEQVGHYDPLTDPATIKLSMDRVRHWIGQGAQPSDTVARLIKISDAEPEAG